MSEREERERRKNPLLESFYFQSDAASGDAATPPKKPPGQPTDINCDAFDAEMYFQELLKKQSLGELKTIDRSLRQTVKNLDNSLKTLVYENYNRFISATETIKSMKQNVEKMESDMTTLSAKMNSVDNLCGTIDSTMASRREKIDELSGVYKLLKGRQFIFELPQRLKQDLKEERFDDAVRAWLLTESALKSYEHLPSFGGINEECKATMEELKAKLWERVRMPELAGNELFAEAVGLLVDLRSGEEGELMDLFSAQARERFNAALEEDADEVAAVSGSVLPVVISVGNQFAACFIDRPLLTSAEASEGRTKLTELMEAFIDAYHRDVQKLLDESAHVTEVISGISSFHESLIETMAQLPVRFGEQKVHDLVIASIRAFINRELAQVQQEVQGAINKALTTAIEGEVTAKTLCTSATDTVCRSVSGFLDTLQPLVDPKWTIGRDPLAVVRQIAVKLAGLFTGVSSVVLAVDDCDKALLMSGLCVLLEKQAVPMAKEGLAGLAVLTQSHATAIDPQFRAVELANILHGAAESLLEKYARSLASKFARLMTHSIEVGNWLSSSLPSVRRPRLVVKVLLDDLNQVHQAVSELFGDVGAAPLGGDKTNTRQLSARREYGGNKDEMARLFSERVLIYSPVDFSGGSVVFVLSKIVTKAWIEAIRRRVLCKHALHQMQVDAFVLKSGLATLLSSEQLQIAETLLDQVEGSAEDRCVDPVPLTTSVLRKIAEEAENETNE